MRVPGSNILNRALRLIGAQQITWLAYVSRTTTNIGTLVNTYAPAKSIRGSLQPVSRELMAHLGLDFQRRYVNIFVPNNVVDIGRDVSSDQFQYGGKTYQGLSLTAWFYLDGWNAILCVEVPQ